MQKAKDYGFKDVNGNDCIVATTFHNGWSYDNYLQSYNEKKLTGYSLDADGNVTYDKLSENYVNQNLVIWKMVHDGLLDKECFTTTDDAAKEKVGNGTALFTCAQYGVTIDATKQSGLYDSNPEMRYTWVGPLNYSDGSAQVQVESEGRSGSPAIIFPTTCSNIDAAMTWLDYVNSKEGTKLICYGFEGDTYELNADGQPRMNAELAERYATDSESVKKELRQSGIGYMAGRTYVAKKNAKWFGESAPFEADAENEYITAYKKVHPVEILKGYAIDAMAPGYENYSDFSEWAFDDVKEKEYTERAFFADTEEEARQIILDYQEYLKTNNGGRGSVTNYKVGFRQNGVTHYRRIQLTDSDANKLASLLKKDENFVKAYMELPDSDKISVNYIKGNMEDSDCKDIYETITSEIKQIGFEKWYQIVTSDADTFLMSVRFSKNGVTYDMVLPISKNMPQSYNKYISIRNEYAIRNNEKELGTMSDILKQYLNNSSRTWDKYTSEYESLSAVLVYNDTRTYIDLDSYVRKDEERAQKVLNGLIESLDKKNFNKNINADNPCIVLNYEKYNPDNGKSVLADAIIQLDGYTRTEDYISDIDY